MNNLQAGGGGSPIIKRQHSPEFKTQAAISAIKQEGTISQLSSRFNVHPTQIRKWKDHAIKVLNQSFSGYTVSNQLKQKDDLIEELYREVGKLKTELDWTKKKVGLIADI